MQQIANGKNKRDPGILSQFKLSESYASLLLGIVVVAVALILLFSFTRGKKVGQTSSVQDKRTVQEQKEKRAQKTNSERSYIVKPGDDLWKIAVKVYGDGYRWVDIVAENKIANPDVITQGMVLKIPR